MEDGPYYAINFDQPMDGMKNPHKWMAADELKASSSSKRSGSRMEMSSEFSAEREAQVQREIDDFDTLFGQLKTESTKDYRARITQIAKGAELANVRPGHEETR